MPEVMGSSRRESLRKPLYRLRIFTDFNSENSTQADGTIFLHYQFIVSQLLSHGKLSIC